MWLMIERTRPERTRTPYRLNPVKIRDMRPWSGLPPQALQVLWSVVARGGLLGVDGGCLTNLIPAVLRPIFVSSDVVKNILHVVTAYLTIHLLRSTKPLACKTGSQTNIGTQITTYYIDQSWCAPFPFQPFTISTGFNSGPSNIRRLYLPTTIWYFKYSHVSNWFWSGFRFNLWLVPRRARLIQWAHGIPMYFLWHCGISD